VTRISKINPLSVVVADKAYDSEDNHVLVIDKLHGLSIMPPRYESVSLWKTHGRYRKQMKRGYNKILYNQRNKDETIVSVIKRLFGEHITSRLIRIQNRELTLRCIAYNAHRLVKLIVMVMVSTQPKFKLVVILNNENSFDKMIIINIYHMLRIGKHLFKKMYNKKI
jgi:hypothetical protein